jgi:hypothetical protein
MRNTVGSSMAKDRGLKQLQGAIAAALAVQELDAEEFKKGQC